MGNGAAARAAGADALIFAPDWAGAMSCSEGLLQSVARAVEAELKPRLSGFFGGMLRAYLPQSWEFRTEEGVFVLTVAKDGSTGVSRGPLAGPDVSVELAHDVLKTALTERRPGSVPSGSVKVTPHTSKGRTAFDFLRGRLGL